MASDLNMVLSTQLETVAETPTCALRFVERGTQRILQQAFEVKRFSEKEMNVDLEWRDVPVIPMPLGQR